jgi:glycosyltransferase involved in cell wall biosynthesis
MRIAIFSNAYLPTISGVVNSISLFRKGLVSAGHDVHIFAPEYDAYVDEEPYIFRFPALDLSNQLDISIVLPLKTLIEPALEGIKPTLIHAQHPVWMGDLAASFARSLNVPLVFTFHTQYEKYAQHYAPMIPNLAGRITEELIRRYLRQCAHIVVPTESIREMLATDYNVEKGISTVPTPVDVSKFLNIPSATVRDRFSLQDKEVLLFVGRLATEKGLDMLVDAFTLIQALRPGVMLMLVGRGPFEDELKIRFERLGLSDFVIFTGGVPFEEVPYYYAAADLFVFPSTTETQGLVIIEAMAAGLPVVAVRATGSSDVLKEGGGILTDNKPAALAWGVVSVLADPGLQNEIREQGKRAVNRFSIADTTERMLEAYATTLSNWQT